MNEHSNKEAHKNTGKMDKENHQTPDVPQVLKTPGQLLQEQRLKLAMDEKQAADHLKITCTKLKAIEADNYEIFSSSVYVRGHLRNYARLVNVSDSEIMDCYYAHVDNLPQPSSGQVNDDDANVNVVHNRPLSMLWRWPYFLAAGLIVLWIVAYPFISQDSQQQMELEQSAVFNDPAVEAVIGNVDGDSINEAVGIDSINVDNDTDLVTVESGLIVNNISESSDISELGIGSEVNRESAGEAGQDEIDQLVLSFSDDCWLEVTDAKDNILAAKLHRAGDRLILRGNAPFSIMLGNVKAAEVSLNGKTIAVTPIGSRRTLRFMVDNT